MSFSGGISEQKSKSETKGSAITLPSVFHFWNGDEYIGDYLILKEKQKLIMDGEGEYRTSDGHTYEGLWRGDTLMGNCKITYPDKSVFSGFVEDMVMQGPGKYIFKEGVTLEGEFFDNRFVGKITLKDPTGHTWESVSDKGDVSIFFRPLHPFWQSMLNRPIIPFSNDQLYYADGGEEMEDISERF